MYADRSGCGSDARSASTPPFFLTPQGDNPGVAISGHLLERDPCHKARKGKQLTQAAAALVG